jgi:fused signal recognition particle receptor
VNESTTTKGLMGRLSDRLKATRRGLGLALSGSPRVTEEDIEELETALLSADAGIPVTQSLVKAVESSRNVTATEALRSAILELLSPCCKPLHIDAGKKPFVIMMVGVNGVGKTTTTGKLAQRFKQQGLNVMLAAADTFRAAAVEQLKIWGERLDVPVIAQHTGADAAAVAHDAMESAKARGVDVLLIDTAGRQATHEGLMQELAKIKRVVTKLDETAPHEVLQVVDGGTGQNALSQVKQFNAVAGVTGIAVTKLDGTSKGGIVLALCKEFGIPLRLIGIGEAAEDLTDFSADQFADAILPADENVKLESQSE